MRTFTLSIGRRLGTGDDLPAAAWRAFRASVEGLVQDTAEETFYAGVGGGIWEGRYEEAATWVFSAADVSPFFERRLAGLATEFGQEAIALTQGTTRLIQATAPVARTA